MAKKRSRATGKLPAKLPAKIPQPHGGALLQGGKPGHRGGGGRPPSAIRALARASLEKRLPVLDQIAGSKKEKSADRIRAIGELGKIGLDVNISRPAVDAALRETVLEIREFLAPDLAEALLSRIRPIWLEL